MPVKVRCPECEKVLTAPDAARGKSVRCPKCEARIKIPGGDGAGAGSQKSPVRKKKVARRRPVEQEDDFDDDFLGGIDIRRVEDRKVVLCPRCATQIHDEEAIECPACGVNIETGVLSESQRRMRERKGPDPAHFYAQVWGDSWQFMLSQWLLCIRTALIWGFCLTMAFTAEQTRQWCVQREVVNRKTAIAEAKQSASKNNPVPNYTDAQILAQAQASPPSLFWGGIGTLFNLGYIGWYWFVATQIVTHTMTPRHKLKKLQFDLFSSVAWGIKGYFWPLILILPFVWTGVAALLPLFTLPIAMIHMTQRYSYKAYLPTEMTRIFFRMPVPVLYWMVIGLVVYLVPLGAAVTAAVMFRRVLAEFTKASAQLVSWANANTMGLEDGFFKFTLLQMPSMALIAAAVLIPWAFLMAFPTVFMMRANGLLGKYFRPELELVNEKKAGELAGFWVRWLAFLIDSFVVGALTTGAFLLLRGAVGMLYNFGVASEEMTRCLNGDFSKGVTYGAYMTLGIFHLGALVFQIMYYAKSESGLGRATLGKRALGIVVTDLKGGQISFKTAVGRYFGKIVSAIPLLAGFFMAAFTDKKQALHDQMAKTLVVFRGDDETTA